MELWTRHIRLPCVLPLPAFGGSRSARWSTSASKCMFWLFALTPHVERETAFKRISQIKQVLDLRQGGAAAHGSTNSIILYFSQDLRSPDQFSASKQTQPVHLQHHPTCHSNMSLQHVTTLSLIFHAIRGYPLFHTQREIDDGFVQSSWRNCMCQDRQTYNGDTPKGKCTSLCMMLQKWRRLPNQLAL